MGGRADEDDGSSEERGANLRLAQRHHKIQAGSFRGPCVFEPEFPHPGRIGQVAICFTTCGELCKESRITCQLPPHGWAMPQSPNAMVRLTTSEIEFPIKAIWSLETRVLDLKMPADRDIPCSTSVVIIVSGVSTPEHATPPAGAVVTALEKLVVRNTIPKSTRGGQIIDGPNEFAVSKIVPGQLKGAIRWQPSSCSPNAVSSVSISFISGGRVPSAGRIRLELPNDGWDMDDSPFVTLSRATIKDRKSLTASWDRAQHVLEVALAESVDVNSYSTLTIASVRNPDKETMLVGSDAIAPSGRITTLSPSGGVIDGPSKIEIAPISQLRERDFDHMKENFDKEQAIHGHPNVIPLSSLSELLHRCGLSLTEELYQNLVANALPTRFHAATPRLDPTGENSSGSPDPQASTSGREAFVLTREWILREEVLSLFAAVYAPGYKYGQELRLACGRGQLDEVEQLVRRGCDPNCSDGSGWSALHYAAEYGQLSAVETLVRLSANSTENQTEDSDTSPTTPLQINARDASGWTPLLCASANGHTSVVTRLLELGSDIGIATAAGRTALHWACSRDMVETATALLAAGADADALDRSGWTPLHCASLHGSSRCVGVLQAHGASAAVTDKLAYEASEYGNSL